MVKSTGGGGRAALSPRSQSMLAAFRGESSLDIRSVPGATVGHRITRAGANAFNPLVERRLIEPSAQIGRSGLPMFRLTSRGQRLLRGG